MNGERIFVDTNILVYAHDIEAGKKHEIARDRILELWDRETPPSISIQVLQEFYVNLIKRGATAREARERAAAYMMAWDVIENGRALFLEGSTMQERWKISFWDALILAAAKRAKATIVWSEDLSAGQK